MTERLFVGLDVPPRVRRTLATAVAPLRARQEQLRWVPPPHWHLTLAFLGPTSTAQRVRVQIVLQAVARSRGPCRIALTGRIGRFGDRVLWVGIADDGDLLDLAASVRAALRAADVPFDDRPFRPHLTLARGRRGRPVPRAATRAATGVAGEGWTARRLSLLASRPGDAGNRYRPVATWPLTD